MYFEVLEAEAFINGHEAVSLKNACNTLIILIYRLFKVMLFLGLRSADSTPYGTPF